MKETLIKALKKAGELQLRYFGNAIETQQKESLSSIVTEVDLSCEDAIFSIIRKDFPDHNILSEEAGYRDYGSDFTWIIDPLDGTSNFTAGISWFGVLIALVHNTNPVLAGAYLPVQNEMFIAEEGKGCLLNGDHQVFTSEKSLSESLIAFSTDYTADVKYLHKGLSFYEFLVQNSRNTRSTNSLVDFLHVARGSYGGGVNLFCGVWDVVAPWLIISEAGGTVIGIDGQELDFTPGPELIEKNFPVIYGNEKVIKELKSYISKNTLK